MNTVSLGISAVSLRNPIVLYYINYILLIGIPIYNGYCTWTGWRWWWSTCVAQEQVDRRVMIYRYRSAPPQRSEQMRVIFSVLSSACIPEAHYLLLVSTMVQSVSVPGLSHVSGLFSMIGITEYTYCIYRNRSACRLYPGQSRRSGTPCMHQRTNAPAIVAYVVLQWSSPFASFSLPWPLR